MFNPKHNLLEEQLATSGLEMQAAAIIAGVSAAVSIGSGILGMSEAKKQNKKAKDAEEDQKDFQEKVAVLSNTHKGKLDQADYANYLLMRDFSHETSIANWEHGKAIQDYEYASTLKQYEKSAALGNAQLGLNAKAEALGIEAEQAALDEAFLQNTFQRTQNLSALNETLNEQYLNLQGEGLNKVDLGLSLSSKQLDRENLAYDLMGKQIERGGLTLDRASKQLSKRGLGFELLSKQADRQQLGFAQLSKQFDRQALGTRLEGIETKRKFGAQQLQNTIDQLATRNTLEKQTAMIQGLLNLGKAELGQAGKSTAKRKQATLAELHRNLMTLDSELSGKYKQAAIQMAEINADASLAKSEVGLNLQRIGLEEAGLDLQGQRIGIAEGQIGLRGQQIGLDEYRIGLQESDIGLDVARIGTQSRRIGLEELGIGVQGGRIGLQEARIQTAIERAQYDYRYNQSVLAATLDSSIKQSERNVDQLYLERDVADLNTTANIMVKPEKLPYMPEPQLPPERIFIERMKSIPGYVPPAAQQNVWAPLIQGIGNAASTMANPALYQ